MDTIMKKNIVLISGLLALSLSFSSQAQTRFSLSGAGRTILTSDKLGGNILDGYDKTPSKGVGGYAMFDLGNNLTVGNALRANLILRIKSPFGAFWGIGTAFEFRQFQVTGKVNNNIEWQIGDINVGGMTNYTVNNFDTEYNAFEADPFHIRRDILRYENFNFGNQWRLQGVKAQADYSFKKFRNLTVYGFAARTNATNNINIPDRILAGGKVSAVANAWISAGVNYVGLLDVPIQDFAVNYQNNVLTENLKLTVGSQGDNVLSLNAETGISHYIYEKDSAGQKKDFQDYFYDLGLEFTQKRVGLKAEVSYINVGPNFTSPSAQTRRININQTPEMFPQLMNNTAFRSQSLYDRFTEEKIYMRSVSPVLLPFNPVYNNIKPYGDATPNRQGWNVVVSTDTTLKVLKAEAELDLQSEIIGEGVDNLRKFMGVKGGAFLYINKMIGYNRLIVLSGGARYEKTTRDGLGDINFTSTLTDAGLTLETLKNIDLLGGIKMISASGNEYISVRDEFNQVSIIDPLEIKYEGTVYSAGVRLRMSEYAAFIVTYNTNTVNDKLNTLSNYNTRQLFLNMSVKF